MQVTLYHTPDLVPADVAADCAVVIDVLRATTTMTTALQAGAEAIRTFRDVDALFAESAEWPADKRLLAGERGGIIVPGFDFGNSPLDLTPDRVQGKRIFMSTTNGTRTLQRVQHCPTVLVCCLRNRRAVAQYLATQRFERVVVVASGWEGNFSLEDTVCAGALLSLLVELGGPEGMETVQAEGTLAANDEAVAALGLFKGLGHNLSGLLRVASHGRRIERLGWLADLDYCAQLDCCTVVPAQTQPGLLRPLQQ